MQWLKHIIVDLITTLVIALVVFFESTPALTYVVYIYTGLMIIARTFTLFSGNLRAITKKQVSDVPIWTYHLLYFLNVVFLGIGTYYLTGAGWVYIWGVAAYIHKKQS